MPRKHSRLPLRESMLFCRLSLRERTLYCGAKGDCLPRHGKSVKRRPRRAGFTLVDIAITILLLGIVAGVAVPRFSVALDHYRADCAARFIVADLNYARHRAQVSSQNVPVNFVASPAGYAMPTTPHLNRSGTAYSVDLTDLGLRVSLSLNLQGTSSVTYNPSGLPLAGSPLAAMTSGTITITSGSATKTVSINPQTGRASTP